MTEIINLTPHDINILTPDGDITISKGKCVARCDTESKVIGATYIHDVDVPISRRTFRDVYLMNRESGDYDEMATIEFHEAVEDHSHSYFTNHLLIVSRIVAEALPTYLNLVIVDGTVRDDDGVIIGCKGLAVIGKSAFD
jgi:hypothetical protein